VDDAGALLGWPFGDRRWFARLALMGLLYVVLSATLVGIPLGAVALTGWMLTAVDNLRAGRRELPPPGLYLRRGIRLFGVQLAYLAVLVLVAAIPFFGGLRLSGVAGGLISVSGTSVLSLGSLALVMAAPALAVLADREGAGAALRPSRVWRLILADRRAAIGSGLMSLLAVDIISPIGLLACGIGLALTATYASAVLAATIVSYERQLGEKPS
jgi:hypothetical protein